MANNSYAGTGTSLSSSFYLRNFYTSNRDARTSSKRKSMDNTDLTLADGQALRRAIRQLEKSEFSETDDTNVRSSVLAFIDTYNNTLSSTSSSGDHTLERNMKQLKSLTQEYAKELDKIGITVNDDGTLTSRESLFGSADISKFQKLFSSDSDYMQRTASYAKRIERRSEALGISAKTQELKEIAANKADSQTDDSSIAAIATLSSTSTTVAQIVAASTNLDETDSSIGQNVDIVLQDLVFAFPDTFYLIAY